MSLRTLSWTDAGKTVRHDNKEFSMITDESTHNGRHVAALVGGGHQCAEVRLPAHAHCGRTLLLHVLGHS